MGVALTPIIIKEQLTLQDLHGKRLSVDGNGELYQFLALIRLRDGTPLRDSQGRITSHLSGLFYRTTRLIADYGMELVFVFDGKPPQLKTNEIARRRSIRERYDSEHSKALAEGDLAKAYSKATMTSRLTRDMVQEARELLGMLGIPVIQAPAEGEAQAAYLARKSLVWAAASKDYDCLLFGTPRLLRFLTISGKEFLPSKGISRPIVPEVIDTQALLAHYGLKREQLVDLAILVGTDFNDGVKGIGPKKALKLVQDYGSIDQMPEEIQAAAGPNIQEIRHIFLSPEITEDVTMESGSPDWAAVEKFLCDEREFSRERVRAAMQRAFEK
jgi:flap structure-specific endonuclease